MVLYQLRFYDMIAYVAQKIRHYFDNKFIL